ncbi:DUF397 domain-containing protein [Streptomyces laurentii]|uniref:DUF397 domain-containing protein n=1 Tax=Streptomyces laurentii TaxID=39478 RepID=UPI003679B743
MTTPDASTLAVAWRTSSYSGANSNCVEAGHFQGATLVRDSKMVDGPQVAFEAHAWAVFVGAMKRQSLR